MNKKRIIILNLKISLVLIIIAMAISGCGNKPSNNDDQVVNDNENNYIRQMMEEIDNDDNIPENYKAVVKAASVYLNTNNDSKIGIYYYLISEDSEYGQFTEEEAKYAIDNVVVDWKNNALKRAEEYSNTNYMSKRGIYESLYCNNFTQEEINYAMDNLEVDWKENALKKVEEYSNTDYMSERGIYESLIGKYRDQFTEEEVQYAMDNLEVDWKENALKMAEECSNTDYRSRLGIYDLLVRAKFKEEEVEYAMDNLLTDWKENALKHAEKNSNIDYMSRLGIYNLLTESEFTEEEVEYAMDNLLTDWKENALKCAEEYLDNNNMSKIGIYDYLSSENSYEPKFTKKEAQYAIDNLEVDWKENALKMAEEYSNTNYMSKVGIYNELILKDSYGSKFTQEEAQYAIDNLEADWKENALKTAEAYSMYQDMSEEEIREKLSSTAENGDKFTQEEVDYAMDNIVADQKKNALKYAECWSSWLCMPRVNTDTRSNVRMSKLNIYDSLIECGFTEEEAQYAIDNVVADWKENALKMAEKHSNRYHMSKIATYDELSSEDGDQFTQEEAQYAIDNVVTDWKENALNMAEEYLNTNYMSKVGIYDELSSEDGDQFTQEEAQYAIDNLKADWKENALKSAEHYSMYWEMSKEEIRKILSSTSEDGDKFTQEEVDYAMDNIVADQKKNALKRAEDMSNKMYRIYRSKMEIYNYLIQSGFTHEVADYAIDNIEVDWKNNALKKAEKYSNNSNMSKFDVYDILISSDPYGDQFTREEAQYAIDNVVADWKENALKRAKEHANIDHMSKTGIYNYLISEFGDSFTEEEAQYGVDNIVADWKENALKRAEGYLNADYVSKIMIYNVLINNKFTAEEAQYAVDNVVADWKKNALKTAEYYSVDLGMSKEEIREKLSSTSEDGDKFTQEEADYAVENLD